MFRAFFARFLQFSSSFRLSRGASDAGPSAASVAVTAVVAVVAVDAAAECTLRPALTRDLLPIPDFLPNLCLRRGKMLPLPSCL